MKQERKFYIKERHNPQIGVYYVPFGQLSKAKAKRMEKPVYGENYMLAFDTKEEYENKIKELKAQGKKVN